jgi:hypothetical protein
MSDNRVALGNIVAFLSFSCFSLSRACPCLSWVLLMGLSLACILAPLELSGRKDFTVVVPYTTEGQEMTIAMTGS